MFFSPVIAAHMRAKVRVVAQKLNAGGVNVTNRQSPLPALSSSARALLFPNSSLMAAEILGQKN